MQDESPKRQKSNFGSALRKPAGPNYDKGIQYWDQVDASVDGVLGGFGNGPVPHVEQLSSRMLLLSLVPQLATFANPLTPQPPAPARYRRVALDVGAGIGRVTRNVLLPLFDDVVLVEPVGKFVCEAHRSAAAGEWRDLPKALPQPSGEQGMEEWKEMERRVKAAHDTRGKRVWFVRRGLAGLDPSRPLDGADEDLGIVGEARQNLSGGVGPDVAVEYDVIWIQWCAGHLSHADLVSFLRKAKGSLRQNPDAPPTPIAPSHPATAGSSASDTFTSLIFVKENVCEDLPNGRGREVFDEEDSSLTRSNGKWLEVFHDAGLEVVQEEVQEGLPEELFVVKTWALR